MTMTDLKDTAQALVCDGKGILAIDETVPVITKRLNAVRVQSTPDSRRTYREMLLTTPGIETFISGVILQDETIRQKAPSGETIVHQLVRRGIIPGIKVDSGPSTLAGSPGEYTTEGLDRLRDRLVEYGKMGARVAKWRAAIVVSDRLPTPACRQVNAHALARYAALCQEQGLVPIVASDVLMDGTHGLDRCERVTGEVLHEIFHALHEQRVSLESLLLETNMVNAGNASDAKVSADEVAAATLRCLRRHVPVAVPGTVFLSGGLDALAVTRHLSAINQIGGPKPWKLSFSYGRALQCEALGAWRGKTENHDAGQSAFYHRAKCASAAALGRYTMSMESESAVA